MIKNLPLLLAMLSVGSIALTISQTTQVPGLVVWVLIIIGVVLNMWSAIGLILHVGLHKQSES
ncbi:hypothetical protein [Halobacillus litoralis]|uniref:hypothetical protein n=1 Tax=Halobacillus litoralis TaxID=45668 RepID=UPI001CFD80E6|nr:hypothetical protein [Halobacillus litoralis]